ncbi:FAD-binding oxidoreductase [Streptomyces sp. NPDC050610]|uniref:FAD-binding oxidoreductase n=1 Tax=Streptomyces sp. NPDC050610 TaxID=3157097 RepID=UPI00343A037E
MDRRRLLATGAGLAAGGAWLAACSGDASHAAPDGSGASAPGRKPSVPPARKAHDPDWTALGKGLSGDLIRPDDADYPTARQLYNTRFDSQRPAAVAYTAGASDIAECLAFARRHGTPVSIRNGGHSYAGWSSGNGRLVIDVSRLNSVRTTSSTTAAIGAGAKLIDVYTGLAGQGVTVPGGSCPTVGISGLTLGGGHGVVSRAYGLTCDSLTGATIITPDGKTLRCDDSSHADLFWALRGAGNGNFGVVTELRFRTQRATSGATGYVSFPWSRAAAVIRAWQKWGPNQPDEIWTACDLSVTAGQDPRIAVSAFTIGTAGDLRNAMDRLVESAGGSAGSVTVYQHTYLDTMRRYAGCGTKSAAECHLPGSTPGRRPSGTLGRETYAARSDFFDRDLTALGLQTLVGQVERFSRTAGSGKGSVQLTAMGGAINRVKPLATAFVHRRSLFLAQYLTSWPSGGSGSAQTPWLDGIHSAMRRFASGAAYQNYSDPGLKDWRRAYYGDAADRLTKLKGQYDPNRVLDFPQAL